jgi:hypothetical protein
MKQLSAFVIIFALCILQNVRGTAPGSYESVKSLVEQLDESYPADHLVKEADELVKTGPRAIAMLTRMLKEAPEAQRTRILFMISRCDGNKDEPIQFVESILAKEPTEWAGRRWLNAALHLLSVSDRGKARKAYLRILQIDEVEMDQMTAISMLKREGKPEDIHALEQAIRSRSGKTLLQGQRVDGVAFLANEAIQAIQKRAQSETVLVAEHQAHKSAAGSDHGKALETSDTGGTSGAKDFRVWKSPFVWGAAVLLVSLGLMILYMRRMN